MESMILFGSICVEKIWQERNAIVHGGTRKPIPLLIRELTVSSCEYDCNLASPPEVSIWQPPPWPWIKVNVDAAIRDFFCGQSRGSMELSWRGGYMFCTETGLHQLSYC